jgi:hypothetical protein
MYIYLDETGQISKHKDSKYFIIGTFTTGDPRRIQKQFLGWKKKKFPRKLRNLSEVKFSDTGLDDTLRLKSMKFISNLDVRIRYSFIKLNNIPSDYDSKDGIKAGHLYTDMVSKTLESYLPISDKSFRVFCDTRNLKGLTSSEFKSIVTSIIQSQLDPKSIIQIERLDSTTNINIQIADWICGALDRYYNNKKYGNEFFAILKNNLLGDGLELFKKSNINQKIQL